MFPNRNTPKQKRKQLRQFGLLVGGVFALIGFLLLFRGHHKTVQIILWSIGGLLIGFGVVSPTILAPIYVVWMKLAFVLAWMNSRILLSLIFFLFFTPISLISRIFGRDALDRRIEPQVTSYWEQCQPVTSIKEHCERQY